MSSEAMPSAPVMPSSTSGFGRSTAIPNSLRRDLPLVSASWSGDRLPPRMSWPGTSVHGTVSERVDGALRPVAGATVTLDSGIPDPPATTTASGFYMICSEVGTDKYRTITALKAGYRNTVRQIFGVGFPDRSRTRTRLSFCARLSNLVGTSHNRRPKGIECLRRISERRPVFWE